MWTRLSVEALKECIEDVQSGDDADGYSVVFYSQPTLDDPVIETQYVIGRISNMNIEEVLADSPPTLYFEYEGDRHFFSHDDNDFLGWRLHIHSNE